MKRNTPYLEVPTADFVRERVLQFDRDNAVTEQALTLLVNAFPANSDHRHILLKVTAINALYSTQIRGVHRVAEHILACKIDDRLAAGDPGVIDAVAIVDFNGKPRNNYSFATKYCSWHRPDHFPIWDSRVDKCLRGYQRQDRFDVFTESDLWQYARFRRVVEKFREHYRLTDFSFKDMDKFFYQQGQARFYDDVPVAEPTA
jgi:hypothetical protein